MPPIITENNIVPLVHTALTGLALIVAAWAKRTADTNHRETKARLDDLETGRVPVKVTEPPAGEGT